MNMEGETISNYSSLQEAAADTGCNLAAISACTKGELHQHKEYRWKRENQILPTIIKPKLSNVFNSYLWEKIGKPVTSIESPYLY